MIPDYVTRFALKCLLKRTPRDKSGAINLEDLSNDYVFVIVHVEEQGQPLKYVLRGIEGPNLVCEIKPLETWVRKDIPIQTFWEQDVKIRYFYRGWTIVYDSLGEAFVDICLRRISIKRARQSLYDWKLRFYNNRIGLLQHAIDMGRGSHLSDERTVSQLCEQIYGELLMNSSKASDCLMEARFMLGSFRDSKEIVSDDPPNLLYRFRLTPKAFETVAMHELEMAKHRAQVKAAWWTAWATVALVAVTAVLVWVTWEAFRNQGL